MEAGVRCGGLRYLSRTIDALTGGMGFAGGAPAMPFLLRNDHPLRRDCFLAGLLLTLVPAATAQNDPAWAEDRRMPGIEVEVANDRLTLHADGEPLAEVLRAIGDAGGLQIVLRGAFATPVRESFADRPLEDAIRRLARGHSVILHGNPDPAAGAAGLAEVRVIENPNLATSEGPMPGDPPPDAVEAGPEADAEEPQMDREAFRLARLGVPPPTRKTILIELGDPDQTTRVAAVPKVGSLGPGAALDILAGVLAEEDDPLVRSRAVAALTGLEGPGARMLLRERALGDEDAELRMQVSGRPSGWPAHPGPVTLPGATRSPPRRPASRGPGPGGRFR